MTCCSAGGKNSSGITYPESTVYRPSHRSKAASELSQNNDSVPMQAMAPKESRNAPKIATGTSSRLTRSSFSTSSPKNASDAAAMGVTMMALRGMAAMFSAR
jgi:hypothetical protein